MLTHDGLGSDMQEKLDQLSDGEMGQLIVTSAKQLRCGDRSNREIHRLMVQACLDVLAERGRDER